MLTKLRTVFQRKMLMLLIVLGLTLVLASCGLLEDNNTIIGQVMMEGEGELVPLEGVQVSVDIEGTNIQRTTDAEGLFEIADVPNGSYSLHFYKTDVIDESVSITVSGGETHNFDFVFSADGELIDDELAEGKMFAQNLRDHGINLTEMGMQQGELMDTAFNEVVAPYGQQAGMRIMLMAMILGEWGYIFNEYGPGEYNLDFNTGDIVQVEEGDIGDTLDFTLNITGIEEDVLHVVEISSPEINPEEIFKETPVEGEDKDDTVDEHWLIEMDFSQIEGAFTYQHNRVIDGVTDDTFDWNFEFSLNYTETFMIETTDVYDPYEEYYIREDYVITLPEDPTFSITGFLKDEWEFSPEEGFSITPIGEFVVDFELDIDAFDNDSITYNGLVEGVDVFKYEGAAGIYFEHIPDDLTSMFQDEPEDMIVFDSMFFENKFTVYNYFSIEGRLDINFVGLDVTNREFQMTMPAEVVLNGKYQDLSEEDGFVFTGNVTANMDYSDFEFRDIFGEEEVEFEDEDNYIGVVISLNGTMENTGFEPVELNITASRVNEDAGEIEFTYNFDGTRFITGDISIDGDLETFIFNAVNERGQEIVIEVTDPNDLFAGELLSAEGTKLADIIFDDGITFEFTDSTAISLIG